MLKIASGAYSRSIALLSLCACALAQAQAPLQASKVATVSTERLLTESKLAKAADAKLVAEFGQREKAIQERTLRMRALSAKFAAEAGSLSELERNKRAHELIDMDTDMQRRQREFREDLNQRQNEERAGIAQKAFKIIGQIEEQEKIDIVLQNAVWSSPRIDITDKVLKLLDQ